MRFDYPETDAVRYQTAPVLATPMAVVVFTLAILASIVLAGLRPTPPGDGPGGDPPVVTASPSPTAAPTGSPTPSPSPTASPTPTLAPTPMPTPVPTAPPAPPPPPPPPPSPGSLPPCEYTGLLTKHHGYGDWPISLLDTIYHLPASYYPGDLVDTSAAGLNAGYAVRSIMIDDLRALAADARAAGAPLSVVSGFRSHAQQQSTFDYWVSVGGYKQALRTSARAGHSEHQLGTAIDFTSEGGQPPWEYADWATTPAGGWMAANGWRYGFVMSYPVGSYDNTCYDYEPWHYRYVGRDLAARIVNDGRSPRQVLWELQ